MNHRLPRITHTSLRDQVVDAIRDAIIQGKLKPGQKIPEHDLSEQLGVSRTPIREAIGILEHQGLVESQPKSGTYVARVNQDEVRDSLLVRASLEELAVEQAIDRSRSREWEELCDRLQSLLIEMGQAIRRDDPIAATESDVAWHTLLIDAARNRYLSRTWSLVGLPNLIWSPERELYPLPREQWKIVFTARHEALLSALRERDVDRCRAAIRFHILEKLHDLVEGIPGSAGEPEAAPEDSGEGLAIGADQSPRPPG